MQNISRWSRNKLHGVRKRLGLGVVQRPPFDNVYYCCVQKTASQWFKAVLLDPVVYRYSGLWVKAFPQVALKGHPDLLNALPRRAIATHLYTNYRTYASMPKPGSFCTLFVTRDPRDVVVSFFYSCKFSHPELGYVREVRDALLELDDQQGFRYCTEFLNQLGLFDAQLSWAESNDPAVTLLRYEELADNPQAMLRSFLGAMNIDLPESEWHQLSQRHSFARKSGGRLQGESDVHSHYRSGQAGDWVDRLSADSVAHFYEHTGELVDRLGYNR